MSGELIESLGGECRVERDGGAPRRRRTRQEWLRLFEAQERSGLSVSDFCFGVGMHPSVFYRARKRLGWMGGSHATSGHFSLAPSESVDDPARCSEDSVPGHAFIELQVSAEADTPSGSCDEAPEAGDFSGVEIVHGDTFRIVLTRGFDSSTLARAIKTLDAISRGDSRDGSSC